MYSRVLICGNGQGVGTFETLKHLFPQYNTVDFTKLILNKQTIFQNNSRIVGPFKLKKTARAYIYGYIVIYIYI